MLAIPLLVFAGLFALEWQRGVEGSQRPQRPQRDPLLVGMAVMVLGSTAVHVAVIRSHFGEAAVLGLFFVLLSVAQVGYVVVLLLMPVRRVVVAGVLANLAVVALWAGTRIVGVPFGIGGRERIGVLDLLATGFEVGCVLCGLAVLYRVTAGQPVSDRVPWSGLSPEPARPAARPAPPLTR